MRSNFETIRYLAVQSFREWAEDNASRLAAALAYYTVFSLPPLLVISLAIIGRLYDRQIAREQLLMQTVGLVGETGSKAIAQILENASDPRASSTAAIISVVILLFGASGVFNQLQNAMDTIWNVPKQSGSGIVGKITNRIFSFTMVLVVGFLLLVSLILNTILAAFSEFLGGLAPEAVLLGCILNFVISLGGVAVLFALIFKVIPDTHVQWRDVWPGAIVTALLFSVGKWTIGLYLGQSAPSSVYGAAGSLIVILVWVYYSAQILFLGAEFTQVYANRAQRWQHAGGGETDSAEKSPQHMDKTQQEIHDRSI
ncbi:MAG: YihY/virulence factor BrkB family protein [Anaerolineae bacterium]|nr:YihY/virulence factor BrkB family protein [Anaerolineae bacterium]